MEPDMLDYSGWVSALDAPIDAADEGACRPADRVVDYYVVSRGLAAGAHATVLSDVATAPHYPIKLTLACTKDSRRVRVAK
eukprot:1755892-Pyramimonas_sp.AAC.1